MTYANVFVCMSIYLFDIFDTQRRQRRNIYFNTHGGERTMLIFYLSIFVTITKDSKSKVFNYINVAWAPKFDQQKCVNCLCKSVCKHVLSALRHLDEYMQNEIS